MQTMGTTTQLGGSVLSAGPTGNGLVDKYVVLDASYSPLCLSSVQALDRLELIARG